MLFCLPGLRYLFDWGSVRDGGADSYGVPRLAMLALAALRTKLQHELAAHLPACEAVCTLACAQGEFALEAGSCGDADRRRAASPLQLQRPASNTPPPHLPPSTRKQQVEPGRRRRLSHDGQQQQQRRFMWLLRRSSSGDVDVLADRGSKAEPLSSGGEQQQPLQQQAQEEESVQLPCRIASWPLCSGELPSCDELLGTVTLEGCQESRQRQPAALSDVEVVVTCEFAPRERRASPKRNAQRCDICMDNLPPVVIAPCQHALCGECGSWGRGGEGVQLLRMAAVSTAEPAVVHASAAARCQHPRCHTAPWHPTDRRCHAACFAAAACAEGVCKSYSLTPAICPFCRVTIAAFE